MVASGRRINDIHCVNASVRLDFSSLHVKRWYCLVFGGDVLLCLAKSFERGSSCVTIVLLVDRR